MFPGIEKTEGTEGPHGDGRHHAAAEDAAAEGPHEVGVRLFAQSGQGCSEDKLFGASLVAQRLLGALGGTVVLQVCQDGASFQRLFPEQHWANYVWVRGGGMVNCDHVPRELVRP